LRLLVVLLADIALLRLVFRQLRSARETVEDDVLLVRDSQALAAIQIDSVRDFVLNEVRQVPDVTAVAARVKAVRNRADIELDITILGDGIDVRQKQKEINRALKQVVATQLGLRLAGRPRVYFRLLNEPRITPGAEEEEVVRPSASQVAVSTDTIEAEDDPMSEESGVSPAEDEPAEEQFATDDSSEPSLEHESPAATRETTAPIETDADTTESIEKTTDQ
jgi:hypothetical protein